MSMEVTTYMLASSLIAGGMNWKQAIGTVLLGNLIVLIPMILNAHAGTKYGIPFPVFVRAPFGVRGANVPAMLRAFVACGWFGIQSWIGGQSICAMVNVLWPATAAMPWVLWTCFLGFWLLNMVVVWRGVESIRFLQSFSAPFLLIMSLVLLGFMTHKAGGFGPMLDAPSQFHTNSSFLHFFFPVAHRHGRLLGYALAQYSRLYALREVAGIADRRPGLRAARRDDALHLHRDRLHFGLHRRLRRAHLEPHHAAGPLPSAAWSRFLR